MLAAKGTGVSSGIAEGTLREHYFTISVRQRTLIKKQVHPMRNLRAGKKRPRLLR